MLVTSVTLTLSVLTLSVMSLVLLARLTLYAFHPFASHYFISCFSYSYCFSISCLLSLKRQPCSADQPAEPVLQGHGYGGICMGNTGAEGSTCNSSFAGVPQCKVTLACVNNVCSKVCRGRGRERHGN
jgi:hypothetical protein